MHRNALKNGPEDHCWIAGRVASFAGSVVGLAVLVNCSPSPTIADNSSIVVQPDCGVTNVCELGMTYEQVRRATGDATIHSLSKDARSWNPWGHGQIVLIPSLGAVSYLGANGPLSEISFKVRPVVVAPQLQIQQPFRGKLAQVLSFDGGPVGRTEVEARFGGTDRTATNITEVIELRKHPQAFDWKGSDGRGFLWYPTRGVAFEFESNILTSFQIYKAIGTNRSQ